MTIINSEWQPKESSFEFIGVTVACKLVKSAVLNRNMRKDVKQKNRISPCKLGLKMMSSCAFFGA